MNLKREVSLWKCIKCFPNTLRGRNLITQQSPVILDLCLRKTRSEKSHDHRDAIVFEKLHFQNFSVCTKTISWCLQISPVWRAFSKSSVRVDGRPNRIEIKLRFQISPAKCWRCLSLKGKIRLWRTFRSDIKYFL